MSVLNDVSVLVAVGLNGDAVAISILEGGKGMAGKLKTLSARAAFAPLALPTGPGLYWFAGRSSGSPSSHGDPLNDVLIDGEFIPLGDSDEQTLGMIH